MLSFCCCLFLCWQMSIIHITLLIFTCSSFFWGSIMHISALALCELRSVRLYFRGTVLAVFGLLCLPFMILFTSYSLCLCVFNALCLLSLNGQCFCIGVYWAPTPCACVGRPFHFTWDEGPLRTKSVLIILLVEFNSHSFKVYRIKNTFLLFYPK